MYSCMKNFDVLVKESNCVWQCLLQNTFNLNSDESLSVGTHASLDRARSMEIQACREAGNISSGDG